MKFDNYLIRPLTIEDLNNYFLLLDNNRDRLIEVFVDTIIETPTLEKTEIFLSKLLQRTKENTYFPYVITEIESNKFIGFIDVKNINWGIPKAELGIYTDIAFAGKGITSKALKIFCDYYFETHKFQKLFLRTHPDNIVMRRVAEKCGFQQEGIIRKDYKTASGKIIDLVYYGKIVEKNT